MKTLVVVMMMLGLSAQAQNASCKAMDYKPLFENSNPKPNNPSAHKAQKTSNTSVKADAQR